MDRNEIFDIVRSSVADSLAIKEGEIHPNSRLVDDLGADSLDFLDIIFTLEKQFSIKLRDPNLDLLVRADFSQEAGSGTLTRETLDRIGEFLPEVRNIQDPQKLAIRNLYSYITVDTLVRIVENKLPQDR